VRITELETQTNTAGTLYYDDFSRQVFIKSMTGQTLWGTCFDKSDRPVQGTETPAHPSTHARRSSDKLQVKVLPSWVVESSLDPIFVTRKKRHCWEIDHDNA
jgi:hypothetical protein